MKQSRVNKSRRIAIRCALVALTVPALQGAASAQQGDLAEGEQLYTAQCKICHGNVSAPRTGDSTPTLPRWQHVRLAMEHADGQTRTDVSAPMTAGGDAATGSRAGPPGLDTTGHTQLAFAPPFGPNLRGVYGRPAGSVGGYQYSSTFQKTLTGMEWNDAALDVWITNTQAWVPGVYMYYKQPDPEIRRKIILYLKANSTQ